ncbi:hypothetical protein [Variovorax sp. JS1663]|uniref:hypothetical protein n=1 Tax=Variovorax sp. JS1663 TaxID=1851577 RepID=UPI000B343840|nr:hypothetical protein [Variovorax sp. JS1663]OUM01642.1 hypothetical protein A8M77_15325 [Variovorax sp. JS1663]
MNPLVLTGHETGEHLIKQLVALRLTARWLIHSRDERRSLRAAWARVLESNSGDATAQRCIAEHDERLVDLKFAEIEIGNYLMPLCAALDDAQVPRAAIFDALETNRADRDTDLVRQYGGKTSHLICVLDLENSATKDDDIAIRPLKWCHTMAFMHALQTNEKLDRVVHDEANDMFGGAFGEYRERPLMERLVGGKA